MVKCQGAECSAHRKLAWKLMTGAAIMVLAAGCTKFGKKDNMKTRLSSINYSQQAQRAPLKPNHPLYIATTHWARQHQKNPQDPKAALNYARNLKALGSREKALEVLARTYQLNPGHAELASEYGRMALSLGRVQLAEQLLNRAQSGTQRNDWRLLSALGTVNAKRGDHKKAQSYYLAALRQKPGATSVYNNLALSYALDGRAGDAETLLKKAITKGHNTPRVRQNLALVLGLQTKFGESTKIAHADLSGEKVASNVGYLKSMVKKTKLAKASRPTSKAKRNTGVVTTAALPSAKKTSSPAVKRTHKTARRPVKTAAVTPKSATRIKRVAKKAQVAHSIPAPSRKPEKPAQPVKKEAILSTQTTHANKPPEPLPWHKKPAAPKATRAARLAVAASWNTSVSQGSPAKHAPAQSSEHSGKKPSHFAFPASE